MKHFSSPLFLILALLLAPLPLPADDPIKVGIYQNRPLSFRDEAGTAQGLMIDVLEAVAAEEGWQLEYVPCQWSHCLTLLKNDELDLLGNIAYSPERAALYAFSNETLFTNWAAVYAPSAATVETFFDLEGCSITALRDDIHAQALEKSLAQFNVTAKLHYVTDYPSVFAAVAAQEVEAGVVNHLFGQQHAAEYHLVETPIIFNPIDIRYAAPAGDQRALLPAIDRRLSAWKRTPDSIYYESLAKWLPRAEVPRQLPPWLPWLLTASGGSLLLLLGGIWLLRRQVALRTHELRAEVIKHERAAAQIRHLNSVLAATRNVNQLIVREKDPQRLLQQTCDELLAARGYTEVWMFVSGESLHLIDKPLIGQAGLGNEFTESFTQLLNIAELPPCAQKVLNGNEILILDRAEDFCTGCPLATAPPRPHIAIRLAHEGVNYGVLVLAAPLAYLQNEADLALLREVSDDIAFAIRNLEMEYRRQKAIRELRASEERFAIFMDYLPASVFIKDAESHALYVNQQMEERFGAKAWLGKNIEECLPSEIAAQMLAADQQALQSGGPITTEESVPDLAGVVHTYRTIKFPLPREGKPPLIGGIAWDITAQLTAEAALQASEAQYRLLAETAKDLICIHDLTGRIQYLNPAGLDFLGQEQAEMLGQNIINYVPNEQVATVLKHGRNRQANDTTRRLYQSKLINKLGETMPVEISSSPIIQQGQLTGILLVGRDLTARQQATRERERLLSQLQLHTQRLQQLMKTVPEGLALLDAQQRLLLVNPLARQHLSQLSSLQLLSPSEAATGLELVAPEQLTSLGGQLLETFLTSPAPGERHELTVAGKIFELVARPVTLGPTPEGWVLLIHDATEERAARRRSQQQERLASVGQLVAGIAHDFNNIMAVIVLYAQMTLRMAGLSTAQEEQLTTIIAQAKAATELIRQLLDFSRTTALERKPLDLVPLLQELTKILARTLPDNIATQLKYGARSYLVNADAIRLQQALMNLAINARDAMPQGGTLGFSLTQVTLLRRSSAPLPEMKQGEWVRLQVTDSGRGIPAAALPHIFDPFFTTKERWQGTGLGLSQVASIISKHGGHIDVTTEPGAGATFTIYLPLLSRTNSAEPPTTPEATPPQGNGETILIVEDNAKLRRALTQSVTSLQYQVLSAANGQAALEILAAHPEIALVLSDLVMPRSGGRALAHNIQRQSPELPVVIVSGHPLEELAGQLHAAGITAWLPKPVTLQELAQTLANVLKRGSEKGLAARHKRRNS